MEDKRIDIINKILKDTNVHLIMIDKMKNRLIEDIYLPADKTKSSLVSSPAGIELSIRTEI